MQRLKEFYPLSKKQIISESKTKGTMTLRGLFQRADTSNRNLRVYPKELLEREVEKLQPLIREHRLIGELDHPERLSMNYSESSHKINSLRMEGNDVLGEITLLNTPKGKIAQTLIRDGVVLGISSRGAGTLEEINESNSPYGDAKWIVNEDFSMVTFDLVPDESTYGSTMTLIESAQAIKEAVDHKANKVFIQVLRNALLDERHGIKRLIRINKVHTKDYEAQKEAGYEFDSKEHKKSRKSGDDLSKAARVLTSRTARKKSADLDERHGEKRQKRLDKASKKAFMNTFKPEATKEDAVKEVKARKDASKNFKSGLAKLTRKGIEKQDQVQEAVDALMHIAVRETMSAKK